MNITDHKIVSADAQLASDYQSVSSENPPAKKAKDMHAVSNYLLFFFNSSNKVSHRCFTAGMGFMTAGLLQLHFSSCNCHTRHQRVLMCCSAKPVLMLFL